MQSAPHQFDYPAPRRRRGWLAAASLTAFIIVALSMLAVLTSLRESWAWPANAELRFQTSPLGGFGTVPLPPSL